MIMTKTMKIIMLLITTLLLELLVVVVMVSSVEVNMYQIMAIIQFVG